VLNSWDYIEYACSPENITKVLQGSTLCFSACAMAMNMGQTPAVRGIFHSSKPKVHLMHVNVWSGYLFATIWINGSLISRCSLPRITITALLGTNSWYSSNQIHASEFKLLCMKLYQTPPLPLRVESLVHAETNNIRYIVI